MSESQSILKLPVFRAQPWYRYEPLDPSKRTMRLCHLLPASEENDPLECTINVVEIELVANEYTALSYTWGSSQDPRWIRLDSKPFIVQRNLFEGLKALRKGIGECVIWIDAICIDQTNISERNHQVSMMGQIYRNARRVYMWLGHAEHENETVFGEMDEHWDISDEDTFEEQLQLLCKRPYFSRQWVVQEVLLAKTATVLCGSQSINWSSLKRYIEKSGVGINTPGGKFAFELAWSSTAIDTMVGWLPPLVSLLLPSRLYYHDPRDRIFSFVSLAKDYAGLEEVIVDYEAEMWELFFGLLEIFRPRCLISFACDLHHLLEVPSLLLIEFFNFQWDESATVTGLRRLSQVFKRNVRNPKASYDGSAKVFDDLSQGAFSASNTDRTKLSDAEFYPLCASLSANFVTLTEQICICRVGNGNLYTRFRITIFGYVLKDILDLDATDSNETSPHWIVQQLRLPSSEFMVTGLPSIIDRQHFCSKLQQAYNRLICNNQRTRRGGSSCTSKVAISFSDDWQEELREDFKGNSYLLAAAIVELSHQGVLFCLNTCRPLFAAIGHDLWDALQISGVEPAALPIA